MTSCICCNTSLEQDMLEEHDMESPRGSLLKERDQVQGNKGKEFDDNLMKTITESNFEQIEKAVTPRALKRCDSNSFLMAMKVNFKLRGLAEDMGPEVAKFKQLANSVEEFTYCLLDPLKSNLDRLCEQFGDYSLDFIFDDALEFEQKKFFTHPAVHNEMHRKWRGRNFMKTPWKSWQLKLFNIWCIFDLVFSPFLLAAFSLLKKKWKDSVPDKYLAYLESPYFKFVRDTLSHLILLALHYALCLSPSTIAFSGFEWIILVFFVGRYLVELKQICDVNQRLKQTQDTGADRARSRYWKIISMYLSDYWNKLDFITLTVYFTLFILRVVTWANGGSIANNRALIVAGYLYSFNTLCLTLRAFGHVMEQSETFGIIQIALFSILNDVRTVFWQFMAAMLAFSVAITKVYVSEKSFIANGSERHEIACKSSGISCWWSIFIHLGWSLLGVSEDVDPLTSVDLPSVTLGRILFAAFLIMGVILLINMLIALLSNTYQRTEENAIMEWSFKRALTVQTYCGYDPIPVPLNIIYRIFIVLRRLVRGKEATEEPPLSMLKQHVEGFEKAYFAEYGNMFPVTEEKRLDFVLKETERNRQMVSQILSTTFTSQGKDRGVLCSGRKAWEFDKGIQIEGPLLTFECADQSCPEEKHYHGARYRTCFSPEFPHFEVTIIETGKTGWLGIGVVNEDYDVDEMPGYEDGSVGYHTDDGNIFQNGYDPVTETKGPVMARRGDRVRCTVMFEGMREGSGKVPVFFALNGKKIVILGGDIFMDYDDSEPLFPHIGMTDGSSVLAKMCARERENDYCSQSQELNSDLADAKEDVVCHDLEIQKEKSELADTSGDDLGSRDDPINQSLQIQENLEAVISREVKKATRSLEEKLDALLARISEKK